MRLTTDRPTRAQVEKAAQHLAGGGHGHATLHYDTEDSRDYIEATGDHGATGARILRRLLSAGRLPLSLEVDGRAWTVRVRVADLRRAGLAAVVAA